MRKHRLFSLLCLLLVPLSFAFGQKEVRFGRHSVVPERHVRLRGNARAERQVLDASTLANGKHYVLLQFETLPTAEERESLAAAGIQLHGYCGSDTYMAAVVPGSVAKGAQCASLTSVFPMKPEWKIMPLIADGNIPDYAKTADGRLKVVLGISPSADAVLVHAELAKLGIQNARVSEIFHTLSIVLTQEQIESVAQFPWVESVRLAAPPMEYHNAGSRALSRTNLVALPAMYNGRGLIGRGVNVGVWDGNVERHIDFGNRLHTQEFELPVPHHDLAHGMHVAGTLAGAGMLDPKAGGIAPGVQLYTYNFNEQSNGMSEAEEMLQARRNYGISLTQNSYGYMLRSFCKYYDVIAYNIFGTDWDNDLVAALHPTLTHVFAAGNDLGDCDKQYGSNTKRMKNALYVGAVDGDAGVTAFSSWGPMDDGRLLPTVCAKGVDVYSVDKANGYAVTDGTSMACPSATGVLALATERYKQLNRGEEPISALLRALLANTADDLGNPGPDYQFGYGLINAEKAVVAVENGWYALGSLTHGGAEGKHTIKIPDGVNPKALRVMIAWTDTVGLRDLPYGEPALLNDLDLTLSQSGVETLPCGC